MLLRHPSAAHPPQVTRIGVEGLDVAINAAGIEYYLNRPILKLVDPNAVNDPAKDKIINFRFLRQSLLARVDLLHTARARFPVDQIEGGVQDWLQHELKYDYPTRLHRHKIGPKSDKAKENEAGYLAKCGVMALKIEQQDKANKFLWVNGHQLRIYR